MITRFAPSPTGYLHLGHALAAREAFDFAAKRGGPCLLRIEDIDHTRCKPAFTEAVYEDLAWLGFNWPRPVRIQSEHRPAYQAVIEYLAAEGLVYPCVKTRREIKAEIKSRGLAVYTRDISKPLPSIDGTAAWRLSIQACRDYLGAKFGQLAYQAINVEGAQQRYAVDPAQFGDVIIARRDIGVSYHIAVTHDDMLQGVTHIVRGIDLEPQTGIHVLLQTLMGWPVPIYYHHGLLMREDGQKLAKRDADPSISAQRLGGQTPADVWRSVDKALRQETGKPA